jgi:EAL domain-containing protein (putative c-di-GMP-specific phosphodiesterase class I)
MDGALEVLERLRRIGVRIALDDFGTGYSSFSYLHRLPVDVLKIDRSFVARLAMEPRDRAVVAGMIDLAHALGLMTVAEGVETPGQLAELGGMSCDLAQGYYFSAPRDPSHVASSVLGAAQAATLRIVAER